MNTYDFCSTEVLAYVFTPWDFNPLGLYSAV